ncbi:hypothetical protein CLV58_12055 [Spirosoma oryzae]|uniref:Uncharacterized protein n=1 Tax=Spirosoma oryzae TaxID=1469603 RepID=A0A2T0SHA9_9BACT|nr:hypothetical protein CLV58_12055 [Spirosoma oryzae]
MIRSFPSVSTLFVRSVLTNVARLVCDDEQKTVGPLTNAIFSTNAESAYSG